ncbi:unnamed protein product, partial [marine sediment metagenome]
MRLSAEKIGKGFDRIIDALAGVAGSFIIVMMFLMVYAVVTRYFFKNPPTWALEFNSYLQYIMAFLGIAWLLKIQKHIKVDVVTTNIDPKPRLWLGLITSILGALILLIITYFSTWSTIDHAQRGATVWQVLKFDKFIVLLFIPIGCFLTTIQFIRQANDHIKRLRSFKPELEVKKGKEVRWEE